MRSYQCAICQREVEYERVPSTLYPFCSPRCRLVDLGKWLREQYTIDRDLSANDLAKDNLPPSPND